MSRLVPLQLPRQAVVSGPHRAGRQFLLIRSVVTLPPLSQRPRVCCARLAGLPTPSGARALSGVKRAAAACRRAAAASALAAAHHRHAPLQLGACRCVVSPVRDSAAREANAADLGSLPWRAAGAAARPVSCSFAAAALCCCYLRACARL